MFQPTVAEAVLQLRTDLQAELDGLTEGLNLLQEAVSVTQVCPEYELTGGRVTGGTVLGAGAVRVATCDPGLRFENDETQRLVVCHADGTWSDGSGGAATCLQQWREMVSCCVKADNEVSEVYVDGKLVETAYNAPNVLSFQFKDDAEVIGFRATDFEQGCSHGYFGLVCGTPSKTGKWNLMVRPASAAVPRPPPPDARPPRRRARPRRRRATSWCGPRRRSGTTARAVRLLLLAPAVTRTRA